MNNAIELVKQSDSAIIILLVVIGMLIVALMPVIKTVSSIGIEKRKQATEREGLLIKVIERNTEVNAALKTLIESDQKFCAECKSEQQALFRQLFDNQAIANVKLAEIQAVMRGGEPIDDL
ncbi:hypothetical protein KHM83_14225 [Fusibacter paucivorans]|uniref:Uncharacterized protein n=1 Tax=Fusibacter paucivorans TaxID=76009 RepID=A0ABS5PUV5_9FIRM|nr:hypothetical protein [Fusibacter paucivorans]MBS7527837.1 hypothetical protein [Fusibacter paucivorans]